MKTNLMPKYNQNDPDYLNVCWSMLRLHIREMPLSTPNAREYGIQISAVPFELLPGG